MSSPGLFCDIDSFLFYYSSSLVESSSSPSKIGVDNGLWLPFSKIDITTCYDSALLRFQSLIDSGFSKSTRTSGNVYGLPKLVALRLMFPCTLLLAIETFSLYSQSLSHSISMYLQNFRASRPWVVKLKKVIHRHHMPRRFCAVAKSSAFLKAN
jgi:hypothetical protein